MEDTRAMHSTPLERAARAASIDRYSPPSIGHPCFRLPSGWCRDRRRARHLGASDATPPPCRNPRHASSVWGRERHMTPHEDLYGIKCLIMQKEVHKVLPDRSGCSEYECFHSMILYHQLRRDSRMDSRGASVSTLRSSGSEHPFSANLLDREYRTGRLSSRRFITKQQIY